MCDIMLTLSPFPFPNIHKQNIFQFIQSGEAQKTIIIVFKDMLDHLFW